MNMIDPKFFGTRTRVDYRPSPGALDPTRSAIGILNRPTAGHPSSVVATLELSPAANAHLVFTADQILACTSAPANF